MRLFAALLLLFATLPAPIPDPHYFRYTRSIQVPAGAAPQVCAVLDADVFAHASPTLADLRLYANQQLLPYATTISASTLLPNDPARVLNLGMHGKTIALDVEMPPRSYTQLTLDLAGANFTATARVTGLRTPEEKNGTSLGSFTLFDLSAQRLSRSTTLALPESTFPFLHIELAVLPTPNSSLIPSPAMVQGAEVPPTREAQTLYTPVARTTQFSQRGTESVAQLDLPAHVPIERIAFFLGAGPDGRPDRANFSRTVKITATTLDHPGSQANLPPEFLSGEITRIHLPATPATPPIETQVLSIPATLGVNLKSAAKVELAVENGDDRPLPLTAAILAMRQRKLCFLATPAATQVTLAYGDLTLQPPLYDLARLFNPAAPTRLATLGPEQANPSYTPRPAIHRSFTEAHPELLWLALLGVIGVLAVLAFRARPQ